MSRAPRTSIFERASIPGKGFWVAWVVIFCFLFFALYGLGLAPTAVIEFGDTITGPWKDTPLPVVAAESDDAEVPTVEEEPAVILTSQITIPKIGVDSPVVVPPSTAFGILNRSLLSGVVHYPGSANPGERGNMFLFGHSSELPIVHNKNFRVFNRLKELAAGDVIELEAGNRTYRYEVISVAVRQANDTRIELDTAKRLLTLSTCKVIGSKEDRYVVEAEFVGSYPLEG